MKAAVICTDVSTHMQSFMRGRPDCLLPLVDRPFVQHVVEQLVGAGFDELHLIVRSESRAIRQLLGDGSRWGARFYFHKSLDSSRPFDSLRDEALWDGEMLLLASGAQLPQADLAEANANPREICWDRETDGEWSGWGVLSRTILEAAPPEGTRDEIADFVRATGRVDWASSLTLSTSSFSDLLVSQRHVLAGRFGGLFINGREPNQPGVRLCRNARMHKSVETDAPVFLGDNVRVGKGAKLGPNTVIGDNCIIDRYAVISNSIVLPGAYVGEWIEAQDCIVGQTSFVNVRLQATVPVDDALVLSST